MQFYLSGSRWRRRYDGIIYNMVGRQFGDEKRSRWGFAC